VHNQPLLQAEVDVNAKTESPVGQQTTKWLSIGSSVWPKKPERTANLFGTVVRLSREWFLQFQNFDGVTALGRIVNVLLEN